MLYFENDYCEGAHEAILKRLMETNMEKVPGYGQDPFCEKAKKKIKEACGCPDGEVYFLVGGTQTNAVVIASVLNRYEGVLSAVTGHVNAHEAGAIEFTGHKVLPLPQNNGKISAANLKDYLQTYYADGSYDHMVFPGMVYISHPTEYGTLYTKQELADIKVSLACVSTQASSHTSTTTTNGRKVRIIFFSIASPFTQAYSYKNVFHKLITQAYSHKLIDTQSRYKLADFH